jgi:hypothetical protein
MIDCQIWRGLLAATAMTLSLALVPTSGFAFPQSTETSGEITPDLTGTWLVVNRIEFTRPTPTAVASPAPEATPVAAVVRPFTVAYVFTIDHLPTAEAQKLREQDKALKQAAIDKANKILAEDLKKAGGKPSPVASGETPIEPKVLTYGIPRAPDSVVDQHDEVAVNLLDVEMPKAMQETIDKANKEEKIWEPTDKDLALLKAGWKTLKPRTKSEYSKIDWKVLQNKYLEGGLLQDDKTKNAKFVISGDATLIAGPGQANRNILIYGADKVSDRLIEGGHVRAIMTAAPFPIPIDMKGSFKMYRLTDPPKPAGKKKDK